jgi:hypothetical protein
LEHNYAIGVDEIVLSPITPSKNYSNITVGTVMTFIDYGDEYIVGGIEQVGTTTTISFDRGFDKNYYKNDIMIVKNSKYITPIDSNIISGTTSPFKFKFIDIANTTSKNYAITNTLYTDSTILYNNDTTTIIDL